MIKKVLDVRGAHSLFLHKIENHTGIELTRSGSHWQSVECGEAQRALDTASARQRAHRSAATQMRDDHASTSDLWCNLRQSLGNVFVREAVKPVAADAFCIAPLRDRVVVRHL